MGGIVIEVIGLECPVYGGKCVGPGQCDPTCPHIPERFRRRRWDGRGGDRRTPEQITRAEARRQYIRACWEAGMTQAAIGRLLGISRQRVAQIEAELGLGKTDN